MKNLAIFYDTETTGLPDFKQPSGAPHQPHIVQLAAAMVDLDARKTVQHMNVIVRPENWLFDQEAVDTHGITYEYAMDVGISEEEAVNSFLSMLEPHGSKPLQPLFRRRIAHNVSFDDRIMRIAFKRYIDDEFADHYKKGPAYCTMRSATNIVKCPPTAKMRAAKRFHYKNPNLGECVQHFFNRPLEGAHDAMVDVQACIDVYFAIQDHGKTVAA